VKAFAAGARILHPAPRPCARPGTDPAARGVRPHTNDARESPDSTIIDQRISINGQSLCPVCLQSLVPYQNCRTMRVERDGDHGSVLSTGQLELAIAAHADRSEGDRTDGGAS